MHKSAVIDRLRKLVLWAERGFRRIDSYRPQLTSIERKILETKAFIHPRKLVASATAPSVIYFLGLPRSGTSLAKNYLGAAAGLRILRFQATGFQNALEASRRTGDIVIDKATHYIYYADRIYSAFGDAVGFCCVVRDPRDSLASLFETNIHREIPRTARYWRVWTAAYQGYLETAAALGIRLAYLVRYEDLVQFPVEVKRHFLATLGISSSGILPLPTYDLAFIDDNQDFKVAQSNTIHHESVGRHRRVEPDSDLGALLRTLSNSPDTLRVMARFGYKISGHEYLFLPLDGVVGFDPYGYNLKI
jgi:hypothetical protein